ncbi:coatomer beta subunit, putative [Eimeria maxima]|uniref:Coatomer beta subunit, putative n=1 Tax=Eimeria maxima TaxID=5804 RepID=U6MAL7_EIMMA|nr:coatomer beta subunit, putative [Eimeria maxima]CDJ61061.1 coatomer beta subunit, putative [Eimeria maxima]
MPVIRYCIPCSSKRVKKLVLLFLEVIQKTDHKGKLKEELILICNGLRSDLLSPNEYVRGAALKLVAKIREAKVVEPLLEAVVQNLIPRHSYVHQSAVFFCVLYKILTVIVMFVEAPFFVFFVYCDFLASIFFQMQFN